MYTPRGSHKRRGKLAGRPKTACHQCSSLKVRCIGEKKSCLRCTRLSRRCTWPKGTEKHFHTQTTSSNELFISTVPIEISCGNFGIPPRLLHELVDLYFSHAYNASLLFHRKSFTQSIVDGSANKHVVLGVCALASCFYDKINQENGTIDAEFGHEWATEARKLVFSEVEYPTENNLVTFLNLGMFWCSQGEWQRMMIYLGNASGTVRALGFTPESVTYEMPFETELSLRRFWAWFLITQFINWTDCSAMNIEHFENIPLPCNEKEFDLGAVKSPPVSMRDRKRTDSFYAEMIRLCCIWPLVCRLAHDDRLQLDKRLRSLQTLDTRLRAWQKDLPEVFALSRACIGPSKEKCQILSLHIIYHQVMCALHSSIVPLFSLTPLKGECELFQMTSAQTAFFHAQQVSSIFVQTGSLIRLPTVGFLGYAAYCSSAVQMPFLWCQKSHIRQSAYFNIEANLKVLNAVGKHWKLVAILADFVPVLHKYHTGMAYSLADEPKALDGTDLNRNKGLRLRARASILGYNKIVGYKGWKQDHGGKIVLDLHLDDNFEEENGFEQNDLSEPDSQFSTNLECLSSLFETQKESSLQDLNSFSFLPETQNFASTLDEYFDVSPQVGRGIFDTSDFTSLF